MHEYPITRQIIDIAQRVAIENNANEVKVINLVVGDYSGYVASSINLYFELIAQDGLCKNAKLNIERIVPKLKCEACSTLFERKPFSFQCPNCLSQGVPTEIGKEFYIKSIEI